jgi:flagellar biosynthesis regulator FlaF
MSAHQHAAQAYRSAASHRSLREQEADVFRRANGALRAARNASAADRACAIADNRRLWLLVSDLVLDPDNALPAPLKAGLASIARTVQHEVRRPQPDFDLLIAINENIAAGLSARAPAGQAQAGQAQADRVQAGKDHTDNGHPGNGHAGRGAAGSSFSSDS